MKFSAIVFALVMVFVVAGAASAQHVKVIDGTRLGQPEPGSRARGHVKVFDGRGYAVLSASTASADLPTLNLLAGEPIRVKVAGNTHSYFTNDYSLTVGSIETTPVPCEGESSTTASIQRFGTGRLVLAAANTYIGTTQVQWKGTCRLVIVTLRNGVEYRARAIFR